MPHISILQTNSVLSDTKGFSEATASGSHPDSHSVISISMFWDNLVFSKQFDKTERFMSYWADNMFEWTVLKDLLMLDFFRNRGTLDAFIWNTDVPKYFEEKMLIPLVKPLPLIF